MISRFVLFLLLALPIFAQKPAPLRPDQVAVVYNSSVPASRELAEFYALNRQIPAANLIGLEVTAKPTINRETFNEKIRSPLREKFISNQWWTMGLDENGRALPEATRIRCLVMMKGLPLRIAESALAKGEKPNVKNRAAAAVDSELSLLGVSSYPLPGPQSNPYFNKDFPATDSPINYLLLVGRLEAHTFDHCKRMILDSIEVEKKGLWGRAYLDLAQKKGAYAVGDEWIKNVAKMTRQLGHPTVIDEMPNTFVTNYPMREAAIYFGWYTTNRNGPFLNPEMTFQKGAVAVHLHSFSAQQLGNPAKNWSAALIDRGAAATLGNVWEPYLQASHHFDIFYARLAKGYSLIEAGYMSMNAISWQNIVIGDPLYRPYEATTIKREDFDSNRDYKLIRFADVRFPDQEERARELLKAAQKTKSGTILEMAALDLLNGEQMDQARQAFRKTREVFTEPADKLRQDLHLVELERRSNNTAAALSLLKEAKETYKGLREAKAIDGLLTILDPPAPPATKR
jgi:uncharacterized protein (TIGR03790 family)